MRWSARPEAIKAVWASYKETCCSLEEISCDECFDKASKTKAFGLLTKIKSFDFIFAIMFMKNIMYKMQLMIDTLQTEELDVSGALLVMAETKESLECIRDAEYEFRKIHRKRVPPRCLDEASETAADLTMASLYRKEVFTFVDTMSSVQSSKISSLGIPSDL